MSSSYNSIMAVEKFVPHSLIIGELLYNQNTYEVPPYQRDYSWKNVHLEDFWKDVNDIDEDVYFFGSILLQSMKDNKNKIIIIDGQQRLTTITILLSVIRDTFYSKNINDIKDATLTQNYIYKTITKDKKIKKLVLNIRNKDFYYHCIQCDGEDKDYKSFDEFKKEFGKLKDSDKLIEDAYHFFEEKINEKLDNLGSKDDKIEYLNELSEKVREKLAVISITVSDMKDAYMIFETINQRGVELAVSDLFKNYLISRAKNKDEMIKIWENIFNLLDEKIKGFLKHYWHSKKGVIQERKLFRELTGYIEDTKNKISVDSLTKEIEKEAKVYSALQNPDDDYWDDDEEITELLEEFSLLKIRQSLPALVLGNLNFSKAEFKKLLRLIVNFGFRYHIICKLPPNVLERKYSDIAIRIRSEVTKDGKKISQISNTNELLQELKKIEEYPNDELFEEKFKGKTFGKDNKIARYILKKIEINKFAKVDDKKDNTEPINYDKFTLEHILPQSMDDEWKQYFKNKSIKIKDAIEWIYRIGNMTLLDKKKNGFSKNAFITKKCQKAYNISHLKINEPLKNLTEWNLLSIENREDGFLKEALEVWKID